MAVQAEPNVAILAHRYELGAVIGHGGMGVVRHAVDRRLGREVAVKVLRADLAVQPDARRRFEDEARAAARLVHPAVVTVFDSGEDGECAYLVMERLPGRTLADELTDGPLAPARVRALGLELLGALEAAHRLGVIHRDVKPGNVLLTEDGRAKLGDFGIAKTAEGLDHTATGLIVGTAGYLAPERLGGERATPASDLYSLGVLLYEALTGERPYRGDTPMALAHALQATAPVAIAARLPGLDRRLAAAVDRAMAKEPSQRFSSAAEMLAALEGNAAPTVADGETSSAPITATLDLPGSASAGAAAPGLEWVRRRWTERDAGQRPAVLVGLALVAAVLLVLALVGRDHAEAPSPAPPQLTEPTTTPLPQPLDDAIRDLERSLDQ